MAEIKVGWKVHKVKKLNGKIKIWTWRIEIIADMYSVIPTNFFSTSKLDSIIRVD